jgi:hypothetical protein
MRVRSALSRAVTLESIVESVLMNTRSGGSRLDFNFAGGVVQWKCERESRAVSGRAGHADFASSRSSSRCCLPCASNSTCSAFTCSNSSA